uniref:C2H2-type domain-containing protein n=1 Tax=Branchiostoma floridae TaxID=7739 RepID=C3ZU90_BRAFL|eukprot:XP_002587965.1 hypothetical protein BRAFLDRAFT_87360 [Branchiostoma floridae]
MAECRYSLRRRQKRPLTDEHPLDEHLQAREKSNDSESNTCSKCGRRFSLAHHFKRHVQTCTSAKTKTRRTFGSFPCKTCGKVFSRSDWLRRHQEVHSKERPFRCKLCSASYKRRDALQRHELIQHTWPDEQVKKSAASEARCVKCGKVYMAGEIPRHMAMSHSVDELGSHNMSRSAPTTQQENSENMPHSTKQPETEADSAILPHTDSTPTEQPENGSNSDILIHTGPPGQPQNKTGKEKTLSHSGSLSHSSVSAQPQTDLVLENNLGTVNSVIVEGETEKLQQQNSASLCGTTEGKQPNSGNNQGEMENMTELQTPEQLLQQGADSRRRLSEKTFDLDMTVEGAVVAQSREKTPKNPLESKLTGKESAGVQENLHHLEDVDDVLEVQQQEQNSLLERSEVRACNGKFDDTERSAGAGEMGADADVGMSEEDGPCQDDASNDVPSGPATSGSDRHHCNTCGDWLPSRESLARHEEKVHGVVSFICPECHHLFHKIHLLEQHLAEHLEYQPHLCTVCKTSYKEEEDLRRHLEELHHFKDLQKCLYCAEFLPTRFHMNAHIRLLHEARRSWCHQCHKTITPFHSLATHRRLTHGERKLRCEECGAMFKSMVSLKAHLLRHRGTNSCLCDYCGKRFNCKKELQGHVAKVHDPALKRHVCEICGHRTWILSDLMDHKYRLHPDQISEDEKRKSSLYRRQKNLTRRPTHRYTCQQCGKKYMSMLHLQRHTALHDGTAHNCNACGQKFLKEADFLRHLETHGKTFACGVCGKTFRKKQNCERHELATCRGEKEFRFTCSVCGKMTKFLSQYAKHVAQHCSTGATHACPVCRETFPDMPAFRSHIDAHVAKGETPWHCAVCNTYHEQQNRLLKHAKIHSDETPFLCPHCGKGFKDVAHLQVHENIHTRAKEYACKECCGRVHENIHTRAKEYSCKDCGRVFAQYSSMKRHELTHNKSQPHQCPFCDRRFSQKCSMDRHLRQHTGETPYVCEICGKGFKQSTLLHNHSKKVHQKLG